MLISHFASAYRGLRPQTPYRGFALDSTGGLPGPAAHHVNPCTVKSRVRVWSQIRSGHDLQAYPCKPPTTRVQSHVH